MVAANLGHPPPHSPYFFSFLCLLQGQLIWHPPSFFLLLENFYFTPHWPWKAPWWLWSAILICCDWILFTEKRKYSCCLLICSLEYLPHLSKKKNLFESFYRNNGCKKILVGNGCQFLESACLLLLVSNWKIVWNFVWTSGFESDEFNPVLELCSFHHYK